MDPFLDFEDRQDNVTYGLDPVHHLTLLRNLVSSHGYQKWIYSLIACLLVGLSGVFPLLLVYTRTKPYSDFQLCPERLKYLLSFAVGSLLGDVFLHLLPEAWSNVVVDGYSGPDAVKHLGLWILVGYSTFLLCEILATAQVPEGTVSPDTVPGPGAPSQVKITGYLNLVANGFDNFSHGLAVAGSFIISPKTGTLTTVAILFHEIPHEFGDFAILLRSGFDPWSAAKAQLSTATVGLLGAVVTLSVDCMKTIGGYTSWILPFTAGCFIQIALSNLLPDLLKEENGKESVKQLLFLGLGIGAMASFAFLHLAEG